MKICHIITRLIIGGAQENTLLTCEGLYRRGHDVTLIAGTETGPEGSLWSEAECGGYRLVRLDSMRRNVNGWYDWKCLRELRRILTDLKCDVVHTHSSKAGILGRMVARDVGVPIIVHTIHGMSFNRTQPWWVQRFYRTLERRAARYSDALITVADAMRQQAVAANIAPSERFTTIRSGMRVDSFCPNADTRERVRCKWEVGAGDIVVGTVARLFRHKGYEWILRAMLEAVKRCDRLRFVWVGDGAQRSAYEAELNRMGLRHRVHLTGLVSPLSIPELMTGFDILVHASEWEGLPRAVVQALLTEVPVVCFDNDGAPEVVHDGETGRLIPFGDAAGLANGIVELANDDDTRARMGRQGRQLCHTMFDHNRMVDEIEVVYGRVQMMKDK